jgi:hypothetical protein
LWVLYTTSGHNLAHFALVPPTAQRFPRVLFYHRKNGGFLTSTHL